MSSRFKEFLSETFLSTDKNRIDQVLDILVFVQNDFPPPSKIFDAIFLHARSYEDAGDWDLFALAAKMIKRGKAKFVVLLDSEGQAFGKKEPRQAYPGKQEYMNKLVARGVPIEKIVLTDPSPDNTGFNTKKEGEAFLELAIKKGWQSALDLNQPHGVARSMLGLIRSMQNMRSDLAIWPIYPYALDWNKEVRGSQGSASEPRRGQVEAEVRRIIAYQDRGDLATLGDYMDYCEHRSQLIAQMEQS